MNRHERRKAASKARRKGVTTVEITPLLGEVLSLNPHGLEVLVQTLGSIETGERDCMTCGAPWTKDRLPVLMARVLPGRKPKNVIVGAACQYCSDRLGIEGVGRAAADYLGLGVDFVTHYDHGGSVQ
ncbi:hypothetical protein [Ruegeria profundi]|uniref:hypothetical protein n=1 Tax=Ruegeria profundi TaxID=1685378 RepID=UPI001CD4E8C1|nr:hypothetical protein [Ruegeria profundi]MCA0927098.1 hypothetical protein [Ruegeria profundi]